MSEEYLKILAKKLPSPADPKFKGFLEYAKNSINRGEQIIQQIKPFVALPGQKILDIGCGEGGVAIAFANAGCLVTAIDKDSDSIEMARRRSEEERVTLNILQKNAEEMDFSQAFFDGALLVDSLEYILRPDLIFKHLRHMLKPGGFCYIAILNRLYWFNKKIRHPRHRRFYFYCEWRRLLKNAGFEIKLLREEAMNKIDNVDLIRTPWRRKTLVFLQKFHLKELAWLWLKSPVSPWLDAYWKILAIKKEGVR